MQQEDYFERLLKRIAAFVARIAGLARAGDVEEAEREADQAWSSLGLRRSDVKRLDDATVRALLGAKTPLAAQLFEAEAVMAEARGDETAAAAWRTRASAAR